MERISLVVFCRNNARLKVRLLKSGLAEFMGDDDKSAYAAQRRHSLVAS